jgi:PAS domain S-box-containing protein
MTSELDGWPVGCLSLAADDTITLWNRQLAIWTDLPAETVMGRPIADVIPAWQVAGLALAVSAIRQGGAPVVLGPGPMVGAFAGSRPGVILTQVTVTPDATVPGGVRLVVVDVAPPPEERHRPTIASLDDSDERFRELSAQAPGAFYQLMFWPDGTRTVPFVSAGIGELFDLPPEVIVDPAAISTFVHPDDDEIFRLSFRQAAITRSAWHCEFRVRKRDGSVRWLETRAVSKPESDGCTIWHGLIHDVTERKEAAEALGRSQALLEATLENAGEAISVVDHDLRLLVANQNFLDNIEKGTGVRLQVGETMRHDWWSDAEAQQWTHWWRRALAGETFAVEKDVGPPDRTVIIELYYWPVRMDGRIIAASCASRDVTVRRRTEAELQKQMELAEASTKAKSAFLATISHEIRTPLNGVLGMADLLADTTMSGEQSEYVLAMRQSALNLSTLLNDLLDLSRIEAGQLAIHPEPFRLSALIADVIDLTGPQAQSKGLALVTDIAPHLPAQMVGDGSRLRQVLLNLVNNAIKFTEQGHVRLIVGGEREGDWHFRLHIAVEDTGIGIARFKQSQLFNKFVQADASTTRRFGGTGLGLAICRDLTTLMGGTIQLHSDLGSGTTVEVRLPLGVLAEPVAAMPVVAPAPPPTTVAGCRLLVVDDNLINRRAASRMLERLGATVDEAADGHSAVAMVTAGRYDLVFMDCQMPGIDGYEATDQIRGLAGEASRTPIVALTAYAMAGDRERCVLAGMNDYVAKPVTRAILEDVLRRWHLVGPTD